MENFTDYYRVLRVRSTADDAAIKAAFRRLVRRCHPDVARDKRALQRFLRAREAYEVLSDSQRRRAYDEVYRARRAALRPRPRAHEPREIARRLRAGSRFVITVDLLGLSIGVAADKGRRAK